jgi:hypothetical protein
MGSEETYTLTHDILDLLTSHDYSKIDEGLKGLGLEPAECPKIREELYYNWTTPESAHALKRLLDAGASEAPRVILP